MSESFISYRLDSGEALEAAIALNDYSKIAKDDFQTLSQNIVKAYAEVEEKIFQLRADFEMKHDETFHRLFEKLAHVLNIPIEDIKLFTLDTNYLDDHGIAFLRQNTEAQSIGFSQGFPHGTV